jgi:glycine/D-amino acid oxidase-like deaminating enzyme
VADVVVVGAGISGIATAWALAERGVGSVVLVDPRAPLSLTSNRPEANYRTWWPQPAMVALAERSLELIADLVADGADIPMDRRGYLYIAETAASAGVLGSIVARHPATRVSNASAVDERELRRRWPHLSATVLGGILVRNAGGLDTVALGTAMLERAPKLGVQSVRGEFAGVETKGGRVVGARISGGEANSLAADVVVDAAGPFAADVARVAGAELPIETVVRQKIVVDDAEHVIPRDAPFTITLDARTLRGDSHRSMPAGIHVKPDDSAGPTAIKIGWAWDQTPSRATDDPPLPPDFPRMALLGASTFIPGLSADSRVLAHEGGYYARTPDGMPLIGRVPGAPDGFYAVAGLAGFGSMMAAAAGEAAADAILNSTPDRYDGAFEPRRFTDSGYLDALRSGKVATGEL